MRSVNFHVERKKIRFLLSLTVSLVRKISPRRLAPIFELDRELPLGFAPVTGRPGPFHSSFSKRQANQLARLSEQLELSIALVVLFALRFKSESIVLSALSSITGRTCQLL